MNIEERAQAHISRMDIVMKAAEVKWGLFFPSFHLLQEELQRKFGSQWSQLTVAVNENRYEDVISLADGTIRGLWKLDEAWSSLNIEPDLLVAIGSGNHVVKIEAPDPSSNSGKPALTMAYLKAGGESIPF